MNCMIDIKKDGKFFIALLPFDPRKEFNISKGTIFVECAVNEFEFKTKLLSRGSEGYCILFNKKLLADIGVDGNEALRLRLSIKPIMKESLESVVPETLENETVRAIQDRASIRSFSSGEINKVQINTILNAGFCAPSAMNKRPFHFLVSESKDKMLRLAESNNKVKMLCTAAACIVVCGDKVVQGIPELLIEDCSAATQNILLAIHSIGLGGVWCGINQNSDLHKSVAAEFGLPNHIRPVSLVALGYPDEKKIQQDRYEPDKIHIEIW